jgi:stage II sporulation protein P
MKWFGSVYIILALSTLGFLVALGLGSLLQSKMVTSPVSSMKGLTTAVSSSFFVDILATEVPGLQKNASASTFSQKNIIEFIFRFATDINPSDPKSLLAREVPGMKNEVAVLLHKGSSTENVTSPIDYTPAMDVLLPDTDTAVLPEDTDESIDLDQETEGEVSPPDAEPAVNISTGGIKKAFIYHSHNRESWIPELKDKDVTDFSDAFDSKINVTLLGARLANRLENLGIGAVSSAKDYPTEVKGYNWNFSYKYSLKTVQEAFAVNPELEYYFDIHRDAQKRDLTTITIDNKDYAQVYFIIGHKNPNWEKNEAFASEIHSMLEERYPGLSRGVWSKTANTGHAEYNQSFSANSILIEVGGPENTLEESYRTIDVLGSAIADLFWDAQKVDSPVETPAGTS